ncbi:hypothetical protein [Herbidospora mongoliensis]|uniref:hypothetical protein n=1 Tax=Herbidospora mongoliensis TaxID=688067 RepID=UPI0008357FC5|nr:hypothetical protein [Herbidospora mongoliensis]
MTISHTAYATVDAPTPDIDLESWLFGLSDDEYRACARGHHGAGTFIDEKGRGMVNTESVGGNLIIQHYRVVRAEKSFVEMYSAASRIYLFHLIPVIGAVRWTLTTTPTSATSSTFACSVEVILPPVLAVLARTIVLGLFIRRHCEEETVLFAADIMRKLRKLQASA